MPLVTYDDRLRYSHDCLYLLVYIDHEGDYERTYLQVSDSDFIEDYRETIISFYENYIKDIGNAVDMLVFDQEYNSVIVYKDYKKFTGEFKLYAVPN